MKDYINTYGQKKPKMNMFQGGGPMPAEGGQPMPAEGGGAPPEGGDPQQQIIALAEAASQGDEAAAMELGMMLAPMIMEQAGGGGAPAGGPEGGAPPGGEAPVFKKGGKLK